MRKKLLSEAQVRRFQSLASIKPLNEMDSYNRDDELNEEEEMDGCLLDEMAQHNNGPPEEEISQLEPRILHVLVANQRQWTKLASFPLCAKTA